MSDTLLKEVDDALKLHRLQQTWRRYGQQLVLMVALMVIALIALLIWKQQQQVKAQQGSDALLAALLSEQKGESALPDMQGLRGAHAQLALLLKSQHSSDAKADLLAVRDMQGANALLANYACLLAYAQDKNITCAQEDAFAPLLQEFELLHQLHAGDVALASATLQKATTPSEPMAARRLNDLRAYVESSLAAHLPDASQAEAAAISDAPPITDESHAPITPTTAAQ